MRSRLLYVVPFVLTAGPASAFWQYGMTWGNGPYPYAPYYGPSQYYNAMATPVYNIPPPVGYTGYGYVPPQQVIVQPPVVVEQPPVYVQPQPNVIIQQAPPTIIERNIYVGRRPTHRVVRPRPPCNPCQQPVPQPAPQQQPAPQPMPQQQPMQQVPQPQCIQQQQVYNNYCQQ